MAIYKMSQDPHMTESPQSGRVTIKLKAGVAVLTAFDVAAVWLQSSQVVTLNFTDDHAAEIEHGLPVDNSLTVAELKAICTQLSLSTSGLKADLLARVQEATS